MMKTATNPKNRRLISGLSILLTLVLVFSAGLIIWLARDNHLDKIQENALNELQEKAGTYDENTIVLYDTSISEATRLAKQLGAKLRISGDGKFATLTLSEGEDIKDVYSNRENRQYIEKML